MKVLTVIGARPQFIKAGPVSRALANNSIQEILLHTGQHYDPAMSQVFFDELDLPAPKLNLGIGSGTHAEQTAGMLRGIECALLDEKPDWVLVYGDTNSTLAGALAAVKLHMPIAHVEAGLRSFNRRMPEEINRILTDSIASLLFTPTPKASGNLGQEGVSCERICLVGDVMFDAALHYGDRAARTSTILSRLGLKPRGFVLATIHRAENTDDPARLNCIVDALCGIDCSHPVIWPIHPRTRAALGRTDDLKVGIPPVGYLDMVQLVRNAAAVVTDSGGVQKEAFFFGVPCVTVRDETEWCELVELGWNRLCPPSSPDTLAQAVLDAIGTCGKPAQPYGGGDAALKIARRLLQ